MMRLRSRGVVVSFHMGLVFYREFLVCRGFGVRGSVRIFGLLYASARSLREGLERRLFRKALVLLKKRPAFH